MSEFIRPTKDRLHDLIVSKSEDVSDGYYRVHDDSPYSFCDSEFKGILLHLPEQSPDGLVVIEPLDKGEDVVLQCHDGSMRYLLRKVLGLALPHTEKTLALLEDDLLGPSLGVNPVGLEEVELGVRGEKSVPVAVLGVPYEEQPAADSCESDICRDVPAAQLAAVFHRVLLVEMFDEGWSRVVFPPESVLRLALLADYDASEVMAFDVSGVYEAYDCLAGEPAVGQKVFKTEAILDGVPHHIHGKRDLVLAILGQTLASRIVSVVVGRIPRLKLLPTHPVLAIAAFLSQKGEVEKHLRHAVGYTEEESLKAKDALVHKVGVDTPYEFHFLAGLGKAGVVDNQAGCPVFPVGADFYTSPELGA